jgi:hypothetical protein
MDILSDTQQRVLDLLTRVHDQLADEAERFYRGPDAALHAANQADRELEEALLSLARSKR